VILEGDHFDARQSRVSLLRAPTFCRAKGSVVFHCHILGREDKGMMGLIRVLDPGAQRAPDSVVRPEHHR
jgi:hypothetical protein